MKRSRKKQPRQVANYTVEPVKQTERWSVERFMGGIGDAVLKSCLRMALRSGYQLRTILVPEQALPAVVILACYAVNYQGVELVDEYDTLLELYYQSVQDNTCAHPDKYLATCIYLLHKRDQFPSLDSFKDVRVDDLFEQLVII